MMAEAEKPSKKTCTRPPQNAPEPVSRTRGWMFVSWYKAPCCSPGDMSGPQLWCWLLRIAPLGGNRELLTIIQTPCKKGSCSQPHERFGFVLLVFFFNFYHCHSCYIQVFWLLFLVPDLGTIYLFAERKFRLSQSWLGVCVQSTGFPIVILGKRKQMLTATPWEFTLLCCKSLHY